ncbi:H-NS histone family protein [mine drainage metagenome]|uniref:H-NS histone family protein n=1 Tax=mine drainage metagenome TaxID=410659 RepID=A0A1J5QC08_9ZZZZ
MTRNKGRTVAVIDREIQRLQKERSDALSAEIGGVVSRIKVAIAHYGLTAADLGLDVGPAVKSRQKGRATRAGAKASPRKSRPSPPKFTDGKGHTWTGVGKRPRWFLDALASGATEESLRVAPTT